MTASVTGADLGLSNTSLDILGLQAGRAKIGQTGENVYVNVATGNLVLQDQDEVLVSRGLPLATLRTYNSQGVLDGDNNDNWRIGFYRQLGNLTGTVNTQGSSITRTAADGATQTFLWDSASNLYLSRDGAGSYDSLFYQGNDQWLWTEGDSGTKEIYRALTAGGPLLLQTQADANGQDIAYEYYANGFIRSIRDRATHTLTSYEYDAEGNKTFEGYALLDSDNRSVIDFAQQASITYDALNRVSTITDPRYSITYEYDAVGNRRHMLARYHDGVNGSVQIQDYWYRYDAADRFTLSMGQLSGTRATQESDTSVSISLGRDGVQLAYDLAGQRLQAVYLGGGNALHVERYSYTADGYLEDTTIDGTLRARRQNDALGRVTSYSEYDSGGGLSFQRNSAYDNDNLLQREVTNSGSVTTYDRAADGTLNSTVASQGSSSTTTYYGYEWWDSARESTITSQPYNPNAPGWQAGTSHLIYDANGHLKEARDEVGKTGFRYVSNAQGLVMEREEYMPSALRLQHYYYLDGKRVGDVGNGGPSHVDYVQALSQTAASKTGYRSFQPISSADFDQNYQPINPSYPGATSTTYTVKAGDSLRSIASQLWGDPAMWYLIADANGLSGTETLAAGSKLTIPNKVTNFHNNKDTVSVYNPGEAMGDVAPNLPVPPPPPHDDGGCGAFGKVLVMVVAAVATVFTAGAAAVAGSLVEGATLGSMGFTGIMEVGAGVLAGGYGAGGLAAAVAGGAVGSIAGQAVGIIAGVQDRFSWDKVATSALGAGAGAGIGKLGIGTSVAKSLGLRGAAAAAGAAVASQVAGNVLSQSIATATGLQEKFDWRGVAASALGAGAGLAVGAALGTGNALAASLLGRFASGVTRAAVAGQGIDWAGVAGDTIGNSIAGRLEAGKNSTSEAKASLPNKSASPSDLVARSGLGMSEEEYWAAPAPTVADRYRDSYGGAVIPTSSQSFTHAQGPTGQGYTADDGLTWLPGITVTSDRDDGGSGVAQPGHVDPDQTETSSSAQPRIVGRSADGGFVSDSGSVSYPVPQPSAEARPLPAVEGQEHQDGAAFDANGNVTGGESGSIGGRPPLSYSEQMRNVGRFATLVGKNFAIGVAQGTVGAAGDAVKGLGMMGDIVLTNGKNIRKLDAFNLRPFEYDPGVGQVAGALGEAFSPGFYAKGWQLGGLGLRALGPSFAEALERRLIQQHLLLRAADNGGPMLLNRRSIIETVNEAVQPHLPAIRELDPAARVGFRGSLARGFSGPHKGNAPFDPYDYDIDAFIVSDKLAAFINDGKFFRSGSRIAEVRAIQKSVDSVLRQQPVMIGLRADPFTFRIYTSREIMNFQRGGDMQYFFRSKR